MSSSSRVLGGFAGVLLVVLPLLAQETTPEVQKAQDLVRKYIDSLGAKGSGDIAARPTAALKQTFPAYQLIVVRFRVYPVARVLPKGLKASNVFAVSKAGKVEHLSDRKTLETFFRAHEPAVKNEKDARTVLASWLTLAQEFHQDGFFKYEILDKEFTVEGATPTKVSGRALVTQGGNGQLSAEIAFDKEGKLSTALEKAAIRPGPRPICQATKLLDADAIVRRMAEQDLLIMGLSARAYLMEQRARATPELRQAIDRLWQQMQSNGW